MTTPRGKTIQRISYVLPLADSASGHRLGVNSLAIDTDKSILFSGGRDGAICAWNLDFPLSPSEHNTSGVSSARSQIQAHTHWVNDIALVHHNQAIVSASSDCSVKIWRPYSQDTRIPVTVGLHTDYAKCLASPGPGVDWIASGSFDKTIRIWDLNTNREKLRIDAVEGDRSNKKGSIYALRVAGGIMASGAPDGIVRIWDYRSGRRITRLTGHTSYVRSILINDLGDTVISAASDQSIKVWSLKTGRCVHTLTMHNESVLKLWSDHPELAVFYSADRSGMIAKTDARYRPSLDEALAIFVAKEHGMVTNMVVAGEHIWTATPSSSINRWRDVNTDLISSAGPTPYQRHESLASRPRGLSEVLSASFGPEIPDGIPLESVLATTAVARAEASASKFKDIEGFNPKFSAGRKLSEIQIEMEVADSVKPIRDKAEETIEGQIGLRRHVLLNDRRRVLTVDTAGGVVLWDIITCMPIQSFGKQDIDKLAEELNTQENMPNWCSIDTGTGRLSVTLGGADAFEAEVYGDELDLEEKVEFNDQQRVQYGKWVLCHLFARLIEEEMKRDDAYRESLILRYRNSENNDETKSFNVPETKITNWSPDDDATAHIPPAAGLAYPAMTPGFGIGLATPGGFPLSTSPGAVPQSPMLTSKTSGTDLERQTSRNSGDYFTRSHGTSPVPPASRGKENDETSANGEGPQSPNDEKEAKGGFFGGKTFRIKLPKRLGRTSSEVAKPGDEKIEEADKGSDKEAPVFEDNFLGTIQSIRHEYSVYLDANPSLSTLESSIVPIPIEEAPPLKLPGHIPVVVQEEKTDSGGVVDLYRGTINTVGEDADLLEKLAPQWLGELLIRNIIPPRDPGRQTKQAFTLAPMDDLLPLLPSDQAGVSSNDPSSRLTAPRILRTKKVIEYVAERLNPPENPVAPEGPRPEEYLEIYCSKRLVPLKMTLQTVRAMIWKGSGDIVLEYKSNGKWKEFDAHYRAEISRQAALSITAGHEDKKTALSTG